ncbi:MAG: glutathione S-transferase family protein [Parvibaculaceae bacterium]|nr:glutathione S-transferase family protein [Parvibaculaceae bacterium]
MKLYTSMGPNPAVVNTFMGLKGITLPSEEVDLMAGLNRQGDFLKVNPAGQLPALVLEDGAVVTEITAICEYLDEKFPGGDLIGKTAEDRAQTRRWVRWVDLNVCEPLANGFRFSEGLGLFENRMRCLPDASDGLKACAQDKLEWLDGQLADKTFVAGDRFSLADILLVCFLAFGESVGQPVNTEFKNLGAWLARANAHITA